MSPTPSGRPVSTRSAALRRTPRAALRGAVAGLVLAVSALPAVALADEPVGWEDAPSVSTLEFFLILLVLPAAAAVVISLLVAVPSMIRGSSYEAGEIWAGDDEWFGGPKGRVEKRADQARLEAAGEQGGAGARY